MLTNKVFGGIYQVEAKLGEGAFGQVYKVLNREDHKKYAAKFEDVKSNHQELYVEYKILKRILKGGPVIGFVNQHYYGVSNGLNMLVVDLLGDNLEKKLEDCNGKFSLKTVLMIFEQVMRRVEFIHGAKIIHRDIRPRNLLVGLGVESRSIYLIDFGKGKKYMDSSGDHIKMKEQKLPVGNVRYTSIQADKGHDQSRRDDLEAVLYILAYFMTGKLPWKGLKASSIYEKYKQIRAIKAKVEPEDIFAGCPIEFAKMLTYVRGLEFDETPDYNYFKAITKSLLMANKFQLDYIYDWKVKTVDVKESDAAAMRKASMFPVGLPANK